MLKETEQTPKGNYLLETLSADVQNRLFPHLQIVPLVARSVLCESKTQMNYVYFPTSAVISLQQMMLEGNSTAFATVGNEGLVGFNVSMDTDTNTFRLIVQFAGLAYRIPKTHVNEEFNR